MPQLIGRGEARRTISFSPRFSLRVQSKSQPASRLSSPFWLSLHSFFLRLHPFMLYLHKLHGSSVDHPAQCLLLRSYQSPTHGLHVSSHHLFAHRPLLAQSADHLSPFSYLFLSSRHAFLLRPSAYLCPLSSYPPSFYPPFSSSPSLLPDLPAHTSPGFSQTSR